MGANCCVAVREKTIPQRVGNNVVTRRNVRYSPSWSIRCDNRTHIEDVMDISACSSSYHNRRNMGSEIKSGTDTETEGLSDGGSPPVRLVDAKWQKTSIAAGASGITRFAAAAYHSSQSDSSQEEGFSKEFDAKASLSIPSNPTPCVPKADPSSSRCRSPPLYVTSFGKARYSPNSEHTSDVSDSRAQPLKPLNGNSSSEERQSFVFSFCSNDMSAGGGSYAGSSDGWSMRTFSELVASSRREGWSYFDSENRSPMSYNQITRSNPQQSAPASADLQTCGLCLKLLKEKSSWSSYQKMGASGSEVAVVAVLACGHVYHADCLEVATPAIDRFDPPCHVCDNGGQFLPKPLGATEMKAKYKLARIGVSDFDADVDADADAISEYIKRGKFPRVGASSSMKSAFSGRPFLRRHFSIRSRAPTMPLLEEGKPSSLWKKGFWTRARRG